MWGNNCWAAILAVWTISAILRGGLARERLPNYQPNYQQNKLGANGGKAAYRVRESNRAARNVGNYDESDFEREDELPKLAGPAVGKHVGRNVWETSESSGGGGTRRGNVAADESRTTGAVASTLSPRISSRDDANRPVEGRIGGKSFRENGDSSKLPWKELESDLSGTEDFAGRSNNFRDGYQRRGSNDRSFRTEKTDPISDSTTSTSIEISGDRRLSWISRGAIKKFSARWNEAIHRNKTGTRRRMDRRARKSERLFAEKEWVEGRESFEVDHDDDGSGESDGYVERTLNERSNRFGDDVDLGDESVEFATIPGEKLRRPAVEKTLKERGPSNLYPHKSPLLAPVASWPENTETSSAVEARSPPETEMEGDRSIMVSPTTSKTTSEFLMEDPRKDVDKVAEGKRGTRNAKSLYDLMNNGHRVFGQFSTANLPETDENKSMRLSSKSNDADEATERSSKTLRPTGCTTGVSAAIPCHSVSTDDASDGNEEIDGREKRYEESRDERAPGIENSLRASAIHKSTEARPTEETYEHDEARSAQRSKVNIGKRRDNSRAVFSTSSTTIGSHSNLVGLDSARNPPVAWKKENSLLSRATFVPSLERDTSSQDQDAEVYVGSLLAKIPNSNVATPAVTDNGANKDEKLATTLARIAGCGFTPWNLIAGSLAGKCGTSVTTRVNSVRIRGNSTAESNNFDRRSVTAENCTREATESNFTESPVSEDLTGRAGKRKFPAVPFLHGNVARERNATYPTRNMDKPLMESGDRRPGSQSDASTTSRFGARNSSDSRNSSNSFGSAEVRFVPELKGNELTKNPGMEKVGTTEAKLRRLSASGESKKSKIRGARLSNPFGKMIAGKLDEREVLDENVVLARNRGRRARVEGDRREGTEHDDGNESISLTEPSNVVREQRRRDAENYEGTGQVAASAAARFDEKLNGPPTNVPIIASRDDSGISGSESRNFLNQNTEHRVSSSTAEIGDNESVGGYAAERAGTKGLEDREHGRRAADNGEPGRTREIKNIKDPESGQSNDPTTVYSRYSYTTRGRRGWSSGETELPTTSNPSAITRDLDLPSRRIVTTHPVNATPIHDNPTTIESRKIDSTPRVLDRLPRFVTTISPDRYSVTSRIVHGTEDIGESLDSETTLISPIVENGKIVEGRSSDSFALSPPIEDRTEGFEIGEVFSQSTNDSREIVESGYWRDADNSSHELEHLNQWPVKHSAVVEGDLVLGGLMMVHEREDTITCGPVMPQGGVQALEAMLYTLDTLNKREIVPGVNIGAHILDDCDKDTYGLEMAVDFIKGSISNIDGAEYHCNKTTVRKVISGVVGAASSVTSIQVANLLRLFRIPQVSFFSTSPELSNKQRFEYFTRTIPSDHYQVKAMVDIILRMGWSYVSIIYEESNYGIKAFEELEELLGKYDICIAIKEKLVKDSGVAEETAYDNIVLKLLTKPRARGCIIFGSDQEVAGVMRAVRRCNATGAFSWIGSDGWSARGLVSNGNEPEVEGTLSVQPQANPVDGFEEYFLNLTVENNRRNPWFVEFWEDHFQCRYPNASRTPYNQKYTTPCPPEDRLTKNNTVFEDQLQFVSDAVMAFGYAFRDMHKDLCHGKSGLCDAMRPTKGMELLKYLRKVEFEGLSKDKFKFDKNGDGPARYNIIHFKQTKPGEYKWIRVGKYLEGVLQLNMSEIQFKLGHPQPPESVCSLPCEVGQAKKYVEGERCCWHCFNCTQYQIRHPKDETQCIPCRQGTVPDETHSACRDIPEEFLRPESGWAIGAMSFSTTGILITLFVCGVFLKHNDTPVVRASGRELSYILLSGILLCYLVTFALVVRPTDIVCGIQRFTAGFCFTVVYAALLTKTNRISRIFNAGKHSAKRPSFISPRSQLIICFGLVFVQILVNGVWMIIDPARAMHHYPTRDDNLLVCNSYVDASYMIAFAYPIMLIVVCTVYAVLTRKIPEAFNESKHIGFTMYTTCVIWLAFVPLYFGTGNNVALRITSMSVTISLSASVTIACLFSPKLYIILIRPERNVRQSMMTTRYNTTKSSAVTATNASSMMAPLTLTAATCDQNKTVKKHIIPTIDCSTQSEYYELEVKDQKNGKPPTTVSRSTQTSNNEKDSNAVASTNKDSKDSTGTTKQLNNNARIGNGPVNQSDVPL